jgi:cytolysin-activating lysine-acyltransferase
METGTGMPATAAGATTERRAVALKAAAAALGEIASVMMRSKEHARFSVTDLEWLIMPALLKRQYLVVRAPPKPDAVAIPGAVLIWAEVSPAIDQRLTQERQMPFRLTAGERSSGDIVWITDVAGDARFVNAGLDQLMKTRFAGRPVKIATRDRDGTPIVVEHRR